MGTLSLSEKQLGFQCFVGISWLIFFQVLKLQPCICLCCQYIGNFFVAVFFYPFSYKLGGLRVTQPAY